MASLPSHLLRQVTRPARYTGGEWNSVQKPWDSVLLRLCLLYPDVYEVGAAQPALYSLYQTLNGDPAVLAERAFAPWPDLARALREDPASPGLVSLESGRPLGQFDVLAICLPHELAASTVLAMLDLARLPLGAAEREGRHPLVVTWEERPLNPEPLATYLDAALLGDAEAAFPGLLRAWRDLGGAAGRPPDRRSLLQRLAGEPGLYVPSLYAVASGPSGTFQGTAPARGTGAPPFVQRVAWNDLLPVPTRPVVPHLETLPDRVVVEVQRGCAPSCPSALLGLTASPLRQRPIAATVDALRETLRSTGYQEVALGAPCLREYPQPEGLLAEALRLCSEMRAALRMPPIALEALSPGLASALGAAPPGGALSLGPEVANDALLAALQAGGALEQPLALLSRWAAGGGHLPNVRLELLLTHPTASAGAGWQAGAALVKALRQAVGPQARLRVAVSFFVPRPFTPWQWAGQPSLASLREEAEALQRSLGRRGGLLMVADPERAQVEAALARGDRRLGAVVHRAWAAGCVLDSWAETFRPDLWRQAFHDAGLDLEDWAGEDRDPGSPLPWGHLASPAEMQSLADLRRSQMEAARAPEEGGGR